MIKYGSLLSELSVRYKKKFLFIPLKTYDIFQSAIYAPSSGFLYDSFGGSKYKMENDYSELKQYKGKDGVAKYDFTVGLTDEIMFIPTASALCIFDETEANYLRDYYQNPPIPEVECPFDAYMLSESSEEHISADYEVYRWLLEQTNMEIIGPEYVTGITTYYVSGYAGSVKWSSSNTSIASIDDSGKLTIIGSGHVTITAESFVNGKLYRKTKDIMVNFPDIFIKHRYATDKGGSFYVKSTSNQSTELLEKLVAEGEIKYEWTIIDGNGEDFTYTSESGVFTYMPKKDEVLTVIVRLIGRDGNRGKVSSYVFNIKTPMETNYKYAIVDKYNKVYWIRSDNKYELGMPSEDFTAYFRTIQLNPEDNLTSLFSKYMKGNQCYISFPGRNGRMEYMAGKYLLMSKCWTFDLFNHEMFVEQLAQIMKISIDSERVIKEVNFNLCNTEKEVLQGVQFPIILKPNFPENQ